MSEPLCEKCKLGVWDGELPEDHSDVLFITSDTSGEISKDCYAVLPILEEYGLVENSDSIPCLACPTGKLKTKQLEYCHNYLLASIEKVKPKVIIPLGKNAIYAALKPYWGKGFSQQPKEDVVVGRWRGFQIPLAEYGAWVCPTYSPTLVGAQKIKNPVMDKYFLHDIRNALAKLDAPFPDAVKDSDTELFFDDDEAIEAIEKLVRRGTDFSFDYETTGLKPERDCMGIVSCAIADDYECFSFLMTPSTTAAFKVALCGPQGKIAANNKFEQRWTKAKLGIDVGNWKWDVVLAQFVLDNRTGTNSVKFQSFVRFGVHGYDSAVEKYIKVAGEEFVEHGANGMNRMLECPVPILLKYNALDALLEHRLYNEQLKDYGLKT